MKQPQLHSDRQQSNDPTVHLINPVEDSSENGTEPRIPSAERAGTKLSAARKKLKLSKAEIAKKLLLPDEIISRIENNEFDTLYGKAYATGYVRAYAVAVDLDPDELIENERDLGVVSISTSSLNNEFVGSTRQNYFRTARAPIFVKGLLMAFLLGIAVLGWYWLDDVMVWWNDQIKTEKIDQIQQSDFENDTLPPVSGIHNNNL